MVFSMYDPKLLEGVRTIHFIGCGGSGTYPLIQILHSRGYAITGSDVEETKNTEAERALGVRVCIGHDAANVGNADLVVYSVRKVPSSLLRVNFKGFPLRSSVTDTLVRRLCVSESSIFRCSWRRWDSRRFTARRATAGR